MRVFLIGFMGSGKSHNGKRVAQILNCNHIDLDSYIEEQAQESIKSIFQTKGEAHFRMLEKAALKQMAQFEQVIVSTGGGTPCFNENMKWINANGISIFLNPTVEVLTKRLLPKTANRPLLAGKSEHELQAFIQSKLQERMPHYTRAKHTIDVTAFEGNSVNEILHIVTEENFG